MRNRPDALFYGTDLSQALRGNLEQARQDVDAIPEEQFLHSSDDEIADHVFSKREIVPLAIQEDAKTLSTRESEIDVRHDFRRAIFDKSRPCMVAGVEVTVILPFTGEPQLWQCRPNPYSTNPPRANVRPAAGDALGGALELVLRSPIDTVEDGSEFKKEIDNTLSRVRDYLGNIRTEVEAHNQNLKTDIRQHVVSRRERLGKHASIARILDIPLRRNPDAPNVSPLQIERKLVRPLPAAPAEPPEPGIRTEDYEHILDVIRHEGHSFEATPKTFAKHDEEELRDIVLAHLNGHYKGGATGETFRKSGKTDIRIEDNDRAAFIAECKVWRGAREIGEAIDQLLGYLTWRDCKACLVIFNKNNAKFKDLQTSLLDALRRHDHFVRDLPCDRADESRMEFKSENDPDRLVTVHAFCFDLFLKEKV